MTLYSGVTNGKLCLQEQFDDILKSFEGKAVRVTVTKDEGKRTINQNKGLWRWNKILGDHTGYTEEEMHYAMCGALYGWKKLNVGGMTIDRPNKTTSLMTTSEFSHHIMLYRIKAEEIFGISLPPFSFEEDK